MKTTIEIADSLVREAKSRAAERGQALEELVTEALQEKLAAGQRRDLPGEPGWMQGLEWTRLPVVPANNGLAVRRASLRAARG